MNTKPCEYIFKLAESAKEYEVAKELFIEYAGSIDIDLTFQGFDKELNIIKKQYAKPEGGLILIIERETNTSIGCVGVRKFEENVAEIKRMYIKPDYRGRGLADKLMMQAIELCRELYYRKALLDTLDTMKPAIALYQKHGFRDIEAYRYNPREDARFFELSL